MTAEQRGAVDVLVRAIEIYDEQKNLPMHFALRVAMAERAKRLQERGASKPVVETNDGQGPRIAELSVAYARADAAYREANRAVSEHDKKLSELQAGAGVAARERSQARDALLTFLEELGLGGAR